MPNDRLNQQLNFVMELDKLKGILRQTLLTDCSRQETDGEHSWHVATMALVMAEYAPPGTDIARVVSMLLVHDVVEIDAGDTFIHDEQGAEDKEARELAAADRLYGLLPSNQGPAIRALWDEFEAKATPESRFADALDRIQPILSNFATEGRTWQLHKVTADKVEKLIARIELGAPALGAYAKELVAEAVRRGYLASAPGNVK